MKLIVIACFAGMAFSGAAAADQMSVDTALLMTCMGMQNSIPEASRMPRPSDKDCLLIRHAKGVPDTAEPKVGVSRPAPRPNSVASNSTDEQCKAQADFFAKTIALRQGNADAEFVYGMAIDGYARSYGRQPSTARAKWYRRTILAVYENPRYMFNDAGASKMKYEDSCSQDPGAMLFKE